MGGSAHTYSNTPAGTNQFQNLLYSSIFNSQKPTVTPNFASGVNFTPSSEGRRGAGGFSYTPFTGRSPLNANGQPINDGYGYPINYENQGYGDIKPGTPTPIPEGVAQLFSPMLSASANPISGLPGVPSGRTAVPRPGTNPTGVPGYTPGGVVNPGTPVPTGWEGTNMQSVIAFINSMYNPGTQSPPGVAIAELPQYPTALSTGTQMQNPTLGQLTRMPGETDEQFGARSQAFNLEQKQFAGLLGSIEGNANSRANTTIAPVAPIKAPTFSSEGTQTQSIDDITRSLMGGNSMFTNNILPAMNSLFNTQNDLTAAAAKESAGNLTGSGFANTLGTALNRNNSTQQALLSSTLQGLASQEMQRQQGGAQLAGARNLAQGQGELSAATTSAQLAAQAQALTVQAQQSGNAELMQLAQMLNQRAQYQAGLEQQASMTNATLGQQNNIFNAGQENDANSQYFNAGVNRNQQQAALDAARQNLIYGTAAGANSQNSQQMMQLLQMLFGGIQPTTTQTTGGIGAMLPGIASILGLFL